MLDDEHYRRDYEIDVELRYTVIQLLSIPGTFEAVQGSYLAQNINLWSRWRAPTGWTALQRPVRYVFEFYLLVLFRESGRRPGFQSPLFSRRRFGARFQRLHETLHPRPPDGQVSLRGKHRGVDNRIRDQLLRAWKSAPMPNLKARGNLEREIKAGARISLRDED